MNILLSCDCGKVSGVAAGVNPKSHNRMVCYCDDCQCYAHFLGRPSDILDSHGGTDVLAVIPADLKINQGQEHIRGVRLTPKGMYRWYAGCCKTPLGNSHPYPKMPFVGLVHNFLKFASPAEREEKLGPVKARVQGKFGIGQLPPGTHKVASPGVAFTILRFLIPAWLKGRAQPSPFFSGDGQPKLPTAILNREERARLLKLCGPKPT